MGNEVVFSQILDVSIQIRTFSLWAERGSEDTLYSNTQSWNLVFKEKPISTNSVGLSVFCIFSSLFAHFASICISFRDDWCQILYELADFADLMLEACLTLLMVDIYIRYIHLIHPFLFPLPHVRGCAGEEPASPKLFCVAAIVANVLKCPTKTFSLHISPAKTTPTTIQATLLAQHFLI